MYLGVIEDLIAEGVRDSGCTVQGMSRNVDLPNPVTNTTDIGLI